MVLLLYFRNMEDSGGDWGGLGVAKWVPGGAEGSQRGPKRAQGESKGGPGGPRGATEVLTAPPEAPSAAPGGIPGNVRGYSGGLRGAAGGLRETPGGGVPRKVSTPPQGEDYRRGAEQMAHTPVTPEGVGGFNCFCSSVLSRLQKAK